MLQPVSTSILYAMFAGSFDKSAHRFVRRLHGRFGKFEIACEWLNKSSEFLEGIPPAVFVMKQDFSQADFALDAH